MGLGEINDLVPGGPVPHFVAIFLRLGRTAQTAAFPPALTRALSQVTVALVDVHVKIWNLYHAGQPAQARRIYNRLLPFINPGFCLGSRMIKELLVLRGIIATSTMRLPGAIALDEHDRRELRCILTDLEDLPEAGC